MKNDWLYHPEQLLQEMLGDSLYRKYDDILPWLHLFQYRLMSLLTDYPASRRIILGYDDYKHSIPHYFLSQLCLKRGAKADRPTDPKALLSGTFYSNARYDDAIGHLLQHNAVLTIQGQYPFYSTALRAHFDTEHVIVEKSVLGRSFKTAILNLQDYLKEFYLDKKPLCPEHLDALLSCFRESLAKRTKKIKTLLKKGNLSSFLTINQYNAPDFLILSACRDLGIFTKQVEHCTFQYPDHDGSEQKIAQITLVDAHLCWCASDIAIAQKYFRYIPLQRQRLFFDVAGSLELVEEAVLSKLSKGEENKYISFFVADFPINSEEEKALVTQWRKKVFAALHVLSKKTKLPIKVRYKPGKFEYRDIDRELTQRCNIVFSSSTPDNLVEDILSSKLILSTPSAVILLAEWLGKTVYAIDHPNLPIINTLDEGQNPVPAVTIEEIEHINAFAHAHTAKPAYLNFDIVLGEHNENG